MGLELNKAELQCDSDGFLLDFHSWSPQLAEDIAKEVGIELSEDHWKIIRLIRQYYLEFDNAPAMRALVNYVGIHLGASHANSGYLLNLFPNSPAKVACRLSGLPKPEFCL